MSSMSCTQSSPPPHGEEKLIMHASVNRSPHLAKGPVAATVALPSLDARNAARTDTSPSAADSPTPKPAGRWWLCRSETGPPPPPPPAAASCRSLCRCACSRCRCCFSSSLPKGVRPSSSPPDPPVIKFSPEVEGTAEAYLRVGAEGVGGKDWNWMSRYGPVHEKKKAGNGGAGVTTPSSHLPLATASCCWPLPPPSDEVEGSAALIRSAFKNDVCVACCRKCLTPRVSKK